MEERSVTLHDLIRRRGQTYRLMGRYDQALTDSHCAIEFRACCGLGRCRTRARPTGYRLMGR